FLKWRRVRTWSREHVADFRDFPLYCSFVDLFAKHLSGLIRQRTNIRSEQIRNGCCGKFSIADIEAKWLKVAVFESALAIVEHRQGFRFVRLHGGNCLFEHSFGLGGSAELSLGECGSGERH